MFPKDKTFNHVGYPVNLDYLQEVETFQRNGMRIYSIPSVAEYPSVTTALKYLSEAGIQKWKNRVGEEEAAKVSEKASSRGNLIHEMCEHYLRNEHFKLKTQEKFASQRYTYDTIRPILNRIDNVRMIENCLYSNDLQLAGRVDCIAEYMGLLSVIDFKTSKKIKKEEHIRHYFIQETIYAVMYEELTGEKIENIVTIIANDLGQPQVFVKKPDDYKNDMEIAINTFRKINERNFASK
jgi:ATP-dependent exoDNAse (exonuclease V) beta subunit